MIRRRRTRTSVAVASVVSIVLARGIRGAVAGAVATLPMTAVLETARRGGAMPQLPPRAIVDTLVPVAPSRARRGLAAAPHLCIGATSGAGFAVIAGARARSSPQRIVRGIAHGLAVWGIGYLGAVPLTGALPPAWRDRCDRQAALLTAHVVYGATLGAALGRRAEGPKSRKRLR